MARALTKLPFKFRIEAYFNVERPEDTSDRQVVFTFHVLFPE